MHSEAKLFEALEDIVSLSFEVALKGELQKDLEYLGHSEWGVLTFSFFTCSGSRRGIAATCNLTECQVGFDH